LEYVEEYAIANLKMQKPASHQIVHISVPKESHTIKNENLDIDDEGFFKKFKLSKIFNKE
ncbi:MAG: hypothetical protein K2L15_03640, partial [Eubacteriales bacterium]|nr:hypothetical protein [Eubacteriales bacterium]